MNHTLKYLLLPLLGLALVACGEKSEPTQAPKAAASEAPAKATPSSAPASRAPAKAAPTEAAKATGAAPKGDLGIGPVKAAITLGPIDDALADAGKKLYKEKCTACHKFKKRYVGPALRGVTERRRPEWVMNMILNPTEMIAKDPTAMALLKKFSAPMADQSLKTEEARSILEYFRRVDAKYKKKAEGEKK